MFKIKVYLSLVFIYIIIIAMFLWRDIRKKTYLHIKPSPTYINVLFKGILIILLNNLVTDQ